MIFLVFVCDLIKITAIDIKKLITFFLYIYYYNLIYIKSQKYNRRIKKNEPNDKNTRKLILWWSEKEC